MARPIGISRQVSLRAVIEAVLRSGPVSRAAIAKQTGLSKQTISEVIRQLETSGWVTETGRTAGHVGRTAVTYEIVPTAAFITAVDLGGSKLRVGICDLVGRLVAEAVEPTDRRGGRHVVAQIARLARSVALRGGVEPGLVRVAVVGVPGAPQPDGSVGLAPNVPGFGGFSVAAALEAALGCDVILENDVNLAVLGEAWRGAGEGVENLAYIALGTGLGGGLVLGGELVRGERNAAGELAFLPFGGDPFDPDSLRVGALEREVASSGIVARYAQATGTKCTVPEIFRRAAVGEASASRVLDETARLLARSAAAICAIADPARIILGGSIGARPEMVARIRELLPRCFPAPVPVEPSALGPQAAIVGAAAIGLAHLHATICGAGLPAMRVSLPPARAPEPRRAAS